MTVQEAAQLVIQVSAIRTKGNIFVLDMGKPIKIIDLAKRMIELSGLTWTMDKSRNKGIYIHFGLRPGEKLMKNFQLVIKLIEQNPKIISIEKILSKNDLKLILKDLKEYLEKT